jgi:hypothetical protein
MTAEKLELNITKEFTATPGPRKRSEGEFSGEQFLEELLKPRFVQASKSGAVLHVVLDGAAGYPTSFLEEAFGGLAREFGSDKVDKNIELECRDEPYQEDEIRRYIREAQKTK